MAPESRQVSSLQFDRIDVDVELTFELGYD